MALQRLKEAARRRRSFCRSRRRTDINLPFITADASGAKHIQMTADAGQARADGRSARREVPPAGECRRLRTPSSAPRRSTRRDGRRHDAYARIQWLVKDVFGKEGHRGVNPDEVVAMGAAIQGAQLLLGSKRDVVLADVTPLTLASRRRAAS